MSGFSARTLSCWTAQVFPSGSANPKRVPPSRSSKTWISLASTPRESSSSRAACGVGDDELQALERPRLHVLLAGQVADDDGAARPARSELGDVHVLVAGVVVEVEPDLVAVERDRPVEVADGHDDDFQGPVHLCVQRPPMSRHPPSPTATRHRSAAMRYRRGAGACTSTARRGLGAPVTARRGGCTCAVAGERAAMIEGVSERRDIVILGSTGSVGTQALDVVRANPDRFRVVGLTAGGSQEQLFEQQVAEFAPAYSGLGEDASTEAAGMACDVVLNAITGAVGLRPTLAALDSGNTLALANKESLIIGGPVVTGAREARADRAGRQRAQCAGPVPARRPGRGGTTPRAHGQRWTVPGPHPRGAGRGHPRRGAGPPDLGHGPGRDDQLRHPGQQGPRGDRGAPALRHPLRPHRGGGPPDQRRALDGRVHRRLHAGAGESADHADPDRARPELARPAGRRRAAGRLDEPADAGSSSRSTTRRSPPYASRAGRGEQGGTAPAVYNAANEVCVEAFRTGGLAFVDIVDTVASVLDGHRRTLARRSHRRRRAGRRCLGARDRPWTS